MSKKNHIEEIVSTLPHSPGVYQYFNSDGEIIYVGKAKDLKKRVSSYFNKTDKSVKVLDLSAKNPNLYTYFIDYTADGKRQIVLFQPTSKMVESLWKFNPRAVKKYNI